VSSSRIRFDWASGALDPLIGWAQLPGRPRPSPAWLGPAAGLATAVVCGIAWRWSDGAPTSLRVALLLVTSAAVGAVWFHLRQTARRRVPVTGVWPAALIYLVGFGPLNYVFSPSALPTPDVALLVEDERGRRAALSAGEKRGLVRAWKLLQTVCGLSGAAPDASWTLTKERLLPLYAPQDAAAIEALPAAERDEKAAVGALGAPLLFASRADLHAGAFEVIHVRLDSGGALVTATSDVLMLKFRLVRATDDLGWRFTKSPAYFD
jgi:hypothetical protein